MKGFILGVIGTLLTGIILFLAQDWYSSQKLANQKNVMVVIDNNLMSIDSKGLMDLAKKVDVSDARLASVTVKNVGTQPIMNATVHIGSSIGGSATVYGSGIVPASQSDADTVEIKTVKSGFDIVLKSLVPEKTHTVWILYRCCEIFNAAPLTENLQVTQRISDYQDIDATADTAWWWFTLGVVAIVAFVVGAIVNSSVSASILKKRGYDIQALFKEPIK